MMSRAFLVVFALLVLVFVSLPKTALSEDHGPLASDTVNSNQGFGAVLLGSGVRVHLMGWSRPFPFDLGTETTKAEAAFPLLARPSARELALTVSSLIPSFSPERKQELRALFARGVPIVAEGGETELARVLGLGEEDPTRPSPYEVCALRINGSRIDRSHFFLASKFQQHFIPNEAGDLIPLGAAQREEPEDPDQARNALLREALHWALAGDTPGGQEDPGEVAIADLGSWNSIGTNTWTWSALDGSKTHARLTLTVDEFKIQDGYSNKDWYLAQIRIHHEVNISDPYVQNFPIVPFTTGFVGWYVQERTTHVARDGSSGYNYLDDYGPTGTISSGQVSISIGGGITTDPSAGINAGYSKSYSQPDVTITDQSSLASHFAKWLEEFTCPKGSYSWWPIVDWPATTSKSSFFSNRATIYKTTSLTSGVNLRITPSCTVYKDQIYTWLVGFTLTRHSYSPGYPVSVTLFKNNAPEKPDRPSMSTPIWVNEQVISSTAGTDRDGDSLSFRFEWGDGTTSPYGAATRSHTYTSGGMIGVRATSKDAPHGAESAWSETFNVFVRALSYVIISGRENVNERSVAEYTCTAYFNDGSNSDVTSSADWGEDCAYASISADGHLTTLDVGGQDRPCTVSVSYSDHGITKTATQPITIEDIKDLGQVTISGNTEVNERSGSQYTCTAHFDDGSSSTVTSSANWSVDSPYASISSSGYLTTLDVGGQDRACRITASYSDGGRTESGTHDLVIKSLPKVATPDIQPPSGAYWSPITVTMTCETTEATIRYTSDGSDPTESSAMYTAAVTLAGEAGTSRTVRAKAFKAGWTASTTAEREYGFTFPGDVNSDCTINILDLICVRNKLNQNVSEGDNWRFDVNADGKINVMDLICVRNQLGTKCVSGN